MSTACTETIKTNAAKTTLQRHGAGTPTPLLRTSLSPVKRKQIKS